MGRKQPFVEFETGSGSPSATLGAMRPFLLFVISSLLFLPGAVFGQTGTTLSGAITQAETNQPLAGALVVIDELRLEVRAAEDGSNYLKDLLPETGRSFKLVYSVGF